MNRQTYKVRLLVLVLGLAVLPAQAGDLKMTPSIVTSGVSSLLYPISAQTASYQDLVYAVRELERRNRRFIERFNRQQNYRSYGNAERDRRRAFGQRLQRFDRLVQQLRRKTEYRQQTYRTRHLLERIQLLADDIDLDLPWIRGNRKLHRSWQRVKFSLNRAVNLLAVLDHRNGGDKGGIRQPPSVDEPVHLPWQRPGPAPAQTPAPKPRPRNGHFPTWGEIRADNDIIEDYSERSRNAFLAQMSTDYQLRRQDWARKARDQFIGFDQSANKLREIVYSRPQNPGAAIEATVRQMLAQRNLIDQLIKGRNVNGETRKYWSVIGQKLDHLSCLLVLDGCPQ